jgi:hypothetical protein
MLWRRSILRRIRDILRRLCSRRMFSRMILKRLCKRIVRRRKGILMRRRLWRKRIVGVFCTGRNRVVKIAHSSSEVVLQTTKHMVIYPSSRPSLEVISLRPMT